MFGHKDGLIEKKLKEISIKLDEMKSLTGSNPIKGGWGSNIDNQRKAIKADVDKLIQISEEIHDIIESKI